MVLKRRQALGALLAVGLLVGSALSPVAAAALPALGRYMQIVAHQDDDLLFMNPDVQDTVNALRETTTVYLTAGEEKRPPAGEQHDITRDDCVNDPGWKDEAHMLGREDYAGCRALGAMASWAHMAGAANPNDPGLWDRQAVEIDFGDGDSRQVEEATLRFNNKIHLVFLNLPEAGDDGSDLLVSGDQEVGKNLTHIQNDGATRKTVLSSMSPVTERQDYDLAAVQGVLRGLIDQYNPTVIRTQDPAADPRYLAVQDDGTQQQWDPGSNDNHDHDATAQIVGGLVRDIPASDGRLQLVNSVATTSQTPR